MRKPLVAIAALILSFALGFLLSPYSGGEDAGNTGEHRLTELPSAALMTWFPPLDEYDTGGEPLDDRRFDELMAALDRAMTSSETLADLDRETKVHLWSFARRLAVPRTTEEQMARVSAYLAELGERHPEHAEEIALNADPIDRWGPASIDPPTLSSVLVNYTYHDWFDAGGEAFEDVQVDGMLSSLAAALELPEIASDFANESAMHFRLFASRLQNGIVSDEQHARVVALFDELKARHPDAADEIDGALRRVESFTPGRVAPNIVGRDTEGVEFELEDYRGNIVVLIFSGEWCGPCIGEYPYHHFLLEQHEDAPLVLLGVNSDRDVETIREAKASGKAPSYRTWWDGHAEISTSGPIATEWGVTGWPAIYVLDEEGVVRYAKGMRGGGLIAAVEGLLRERRMREYSGPAAMTAPVPATSARQADPDPGAQRDR